MLVWMVWRREKSLAHAGIVPKLLSREEISLYVIIIEDVFSTVIACKSVLEGDFQQFLRHLLDICGT